MEKICKNCGVKFFSENNAQKHCCVECRKEYTKNNREKNNLKTIICKYCGQAFNTLRKCAYCSKECRDRANGRAKKSSRSMRKKPPVPLAEINRLARECGLSYGEYVRKYDC